MVDRHLRLCFINPTRAPKAMIYGLAKHLPKRKFRVTILQPSYRGFNRYYTPEGIKVVSFPSLFFPKISYTLPFIPEGLRTLLKLRNYDIIHVGDYFYPTSIPPLISNRRGTNAMILSINALPGYSWRFGSMLVDLAAKGYTYSIGKQILSSYDKIVALYNELSEDLRRLGISSRKICVIPNGVDVERFQNIDQAYCDKLRKRLSIHNNERIVLFVGRLAKVKRVDLVIRLAKKFSQEGQRIKTIIVGEGAYRNSYEQLAQSERGVIFIGGVSPTVVPAFYALADVVVLPSLSEGLPNVLLEASAAGKPAIATNVGGVSDIIVNGKTGFLIGQSDFDSFYNFTKLILADQALKKELGHNAVVHIKKKFSWRTIVEKYERLYEELLY